MNPLFRIDWWRIDDLTLTFSGLAKAGYAVTALTIELNL